MGQPHLHVFFYITGLQPQNKKRSLKNVFFLKHCALRIKFIGPIGASEHCKDL